MTSRARTAATAAAGVGGPVILSLLALLATPARAQTIRPATTVTACDFDAAALDLALAVELQSTGAAIAAATANISITVTCATDGTATVTVQHGDLPPTSRSLDLVDVPAPLAPRVVALVAVAAVHRPPPPAPALPASDLSTPDAAATPAPPLAPPAAAGVDIAPTMTTRANLGSTGLSSHPRGVSARALARLHDGTTALWGASAALTAGSGSLGIAAAGARIDHALGQLTPWLVAAELGVSVACAGAACAGLHVEVGRIAVAAVATDPMVSTRPLAATYVHGAAELSFGTRLAGLEVAAIAALGVSRGVIARVDTEAVAVVAGWTLGGAIEVRR